MTTASMLRALVAPALRVLAASIALCAALGSAQANDLARADVIGFSRDGRYVAFEDYGMQDGSGFPYSTIYVLDVAANDWVAGSPIRVLLDYDALPDIEEIDDGISRARTQAMAEAQSVLDSHGIVPGETGTTLIYQPLSDLTASPHEVPFSITGGFGPQTYDTNVMRITEQTVPSPECDRYDLGPVAMMTLQLQQPHLEDALVLQQDSDLPASRGCATGYRIESIVVYAPNAPDQHNCCASPLAMLVIVAMSQFGFEGPDWRHIGVTTMVDVVW